MRTSPGLSGGAAPAWNGGDAWLVYPDVEPDGSRRFAVDHAPGYVAGGVLVVDDRAAGASLFRFGPGAAGFDLLVSGLFFTGSITPTSLDHLTLSGTLEPSTLHASALALAYSARPCDDRVRPLPRGPRPPRHPRPRHALRPVRGPDRPVRRDLVRMDARRGARAARRGRGRRGRERWGAWVPLSATIRGDGRATCGDVCPTRREACSPRREACSPRREAWSPSRRPALPAGRPGLRAGGLLSPQGGLVSPQGGLLSPLEAWSPRREACSPRWRRGLPAGRPALPAGGVVSPQGGVVSPLEAWSPRREAWSPRWRRGLPAGRPALPAGRRGLPAGRPALPAGRPGLPAGRPALPAGRPALPAGRPGLRAGGLVSPQGGLLYRRDGRPTRGDVCAVARDAERQARTSRPNAPNQRARSSFKEPLSNVWNPGREPADRSACVSTRRPRHSPLTSWSPRSRARLRSAGSRPWVPSLCQDRARPFRAACVCIGYAPTEPRAQASGCQKARRFRALACVALQAARRGQGRGA